ncbi:nuclear transport factor 2 family protein [Falsiroseomonas sp. E2-1-a20]|uniref:nuclear transport factor 2 family protein n=1 Tax=Falsiroseomonas sp. E2-1-a20 TaxID=3239300 RepID=UPI003F2ED6A7
MKTLPRRAAFATLAFLLAAPGARAQAATAGRDLVQEERNRRLVVEFYEGAFIRRDLGVVRRLLAEDGRARFATLFTRILATGPEARSRIVRSAAEGDLVWLDVHVTPAPDASGSTIVDIFRVADGRIAEHWDVVHPA